MVRVLAFSSGSRHSEQSAGEAPRVGAGLQGAQQIPTIHLLRVFGLEQQV